VREIVRHKDDTESGLSIPLCSSQPLITGSSFREAIAHRARRALLKKNAEQGRQTKLRPKARHYYSDEELITEESESEDGSDW
jgi:hypothetical protein